jgi:pimeloyl-ACP methyl ester carboxylesterase
VAAGRWIGDVREPAGVERLEILIDADGTAAELTLPGWGLAGVALSRAAAAPPSLDFAAAIEGETVTLRGSLEDERWLGELARGARTAPFELRRVHDLSDSEWRSLIGSYRSEDGRLLAIAPFSEFGPQPMVVDYTSGRIGPLYPLSRERHLVGHALVAPVFPADPLEAVFRRDGEVEGLRFGPPGQRTAVAGRVPTRDEEVRFTSGAIALGGTLTLPAGPPPHPALVLVHGSNALTRDVFGPWTRFFAAQGFAVLAYDKRGTGTSTGDWRQADFPQLAADVLAGVRFLAARSDIRSDRIGLWGASQAGWIMPIAAAEAPREVAFMVVHAGSGTTVREQGVLSIEHELRAAGLPEASVAVGTRYQRLDDEVSQSGSGWQSLQRFYDDHSRVETWLWPPRPADDWFRPYYRMLMDFDPAPYWRRVRCPVLLFFGELDLTVPPGAAWPPIERALLAADHDRFRHVVLAKANHLFLEARTGGRDEYPALTRFVPGYFDAMAGWLAAQAR